MQQITIDAIESKEFAIRKNGYDQDEVDSFLDDICDEMERQLGTINKLQQQLGLPKMRFHGLRHSFATRCIESKCDYKTLSTLLGHSNVTTTLNIYAHPDINQKRKCIEDMIKII